MKRCVITQLPEFFVGSAEQKWDSLACGHGEFTVRYLALAMFRQSRFFWIYAWLWACPTHRTKEYDVREPKNHPQTWIRAFQRVWGCQGYLYWNMFWHKSGTRFAATLALFRLTTCNCASRIFNLEDDMDACQGLQMIMKSWRALRTL